MNATFVENRIFADAIMLRCGHQGGADLRNNFLLRRKFGHRQTEGKRPANMGQRLSEAVTGQGTAGATGRWMRPGRSALQKLWKEQAAYCARLSVR